jgi:hypothetical protein
MAKALLPELLREYLAAQAAKAREINHDQFLRQQAASDPFLGEDAHLTRDAFAGRGDVESEQPAELDAWGHVRQ